MKAYGFDVPEGYNWVAVDEDGEVYAFIEKPELQSSMTVLKFGIIHLIHGVRRLVSLVTSPLMKIRLLR